MFRLGCLLQHRERREKDVKHCEPGEEAVNVALASPTFWIEGEVSDAVETREISLL